MASTQVPSLADRRPLIKELRPRWSAAAESESGPERTSIMNSFATLADKEMERRNARRRLDVGKGCDHGIRFNLALGYTRYGLRYDDEPDAGDRAKRQERRCFPCVHVIIYTSVWTGLLLRSETATQELKLSVPCNF
jgi:hypothetical protein